jgi:SAM-dependent methyltransferase
MLNYRTSLAGSSSPLPRLASCDEAGRDDLHRLRVAYADMERRWASSDLYSPFNPAYLFSVQQRQRATLRLLRRYGFNSLRHRRLLEIGCDRGGILLEYLGYGATAKHLHGAELLSDRVMEARRRLPHLPLTCADGQHLPYQSGVFDLVLQYTVFTSILDDGIKANLAAEMMRVLKPDGLILWYDFWLNPTNKQTRGIRPAEIRRLFRQCQCEFHRITLAPPLSRRIAAISWPLAYLLEQMKIFNTHYLVAIRKM